MFLSGASNITVGSAENFTLNRTALAAEVQDEYLQDPGFWREVIVQYRKDGEQQRVHLSFVNGVDVASFALSAKAMTGTWKLENVAIIDNDYGKELLNGADVIDSALYNVTVS